MGALRIGGAVTTAGHVARCAAAAVLAFAAAAAPPPADARLPQELASGGAVADMAAALRREIDESASSGRDDALAARSAVRRIAFDLLYRGAAPDAPQAAAMAGLRLAWLRSEIDAAVSAPPADADRRARFDAAIAHFAQVASHGIAGEIDPAQPDLAIAPLLGPLEAAIAAATGGSVPAPGATWPRDPGPAEGGADGAGAPDADDLPARPADDESRAGLLAGWTDMFSACDERAGRGFARVAERWRSALRDPARRGAARAAIDALADEATLGRPGPFELRVRRGEPDARAACLGRAEALLAEVDRARAGWARAWADGAGAPDATARLRTATDLLRALASASRLAIPDDAPRRLAGWGGLAVPPEGWTLTATAARARLSLSVESLLEGDLERATSTLRTAEGELAVLHVLAAPLRWAGPALPSDPSLATRLAAARDAPAAGSFLGAARSQVALLARLMAEERRARTTGSPALADALRAMAAKAAARLRP